MPVPVRASNRRKSSRVLLGGLVAGWLAAGCAQGGAQGPDPYPADSYPEPPSTQVYAYPARGQSPERQDRDRYECYRWSKRQTGFDPSLAASVAPPPPPRVVPVPPPGSSLIAGAATGAIIGAAVSSWKHTADGAAWGAAAGALLGALADAGRVQQARQVQSVYAQRSNAAAARFDERASGYRRALSACLEGRGYTVQ